MTENTRRWRERFESRRAGASPIKHYQAARSLSSTRSLHEQPRKNERLRPTVGLDNDIRRHPHSDVPAEGRAADLSRELGSVLPRLAVIGEVYPDRTTSGALLLYRLLRSYPPDRLLVVNNADQGDQNPATRLPGVPYRPLRYRIPRVIRNRFNPAWPVGSALYVGRGLSEVTEAVGDFRPEAVLGVTQWFLWLAGAAFARRRRIPLHLILHDEWTTWTGGAGLELVHCGMQLVMRRAYQQARSRLCVSPGMAEQYERWFDAPGACFTRVGGRQPDPGPPGPQDVGRAACRRVRRTSSFPPVGIAHLLRKMAEVLAALGGHLDLYSRTSVDWLASVGLTPPTVRVAGFFPAAEMAERVAATAHALFLPASFRPEEQVHASTLFPSKLADYTAIGMPILVWGPTYSSAARWAAENPDGAVLLAGDDPGPVRSAVLRLAADREYAIRLAAAAITSGERYFDLGVARVMLYSPLPSGLGVMIRPTKARDYNS